MKSNIEKNKRTRSLFAQLNIYVAIALSALIKACGGKSSSSGGGNVGVNIKSSEEVQKYLTQNDDNKIDNKDKQKLEGLERQNKAEKKRLDEANQNQAADKINQQNQQNQQNQASALVEAQRLEAEKKLKLEQQANIIYDESQDQQNNHNQADKQITEELLNIDNTKENNSKISDSSSSNINANKINVIINPLAKSKAISNVAELIYTKLLTLKSGIFNKCHFQDLISIGNRQEMIASLNSSFEEIKKQKYENDFIFYQDIECICQKLTEEISKDSMEKKQLDILKAQKNTLEKIVLTKCDYEIIPYLNRLKIDYTTGVYSIPVVAKPTKPILVSKLANSLAITSTSA
jgi:hypothetical protein